MALTKYNNNSLSNLTALPASIPTGKLKFISSQTASNSASISFTSGLTSTYKIYRFVFSNIHPRTDGVQFQFNLSTDSGSNYNVTKTTTGIMARHYEDDTAPTLRYESTLALAQSTSYNPLAYNCGFDAKENTSGIFILFNPASTTYVKHFISSVCSSYFDPAIYNNYVAGYGNTTSAVNAIRFQMSSGNFDGTIYLYGIEN